MLNINPRRLATAFHSLYQEVHTISPLYLKQYGRMGRNFLKGMIGDIINPIISAIGLNLRCIANHLQIVSNST